MYTHRHTHTPMHKQTYTHTHTHQRAIFIIAPWRACLGSWESIQQFNQADDLRLTPPFQFPHPPLPISHPFIKQPASPPFFPRRRPQNTDWHSGNALSWRPSGNARAAGKQSVQNASTTWQKREREVEDGEWIERKRERARKGKVENGELER